MAMILDGVASPLQISAYLMLLRRNGETAEELAGMVEAMRAHLPPVRRLAVDLDWPSYAEPHNQQPWFLLAALALAQGGVRVLMHGRPSDAEQPTLTRAALSLLGIEPMAGLAEAKSALGDHGFAYVGLETLLPEFHRLFAYRQQLGVRTCVNTLARALNPGSARAQLIGVAHPAYQRLHQDLLCLLDQPAAAILKGGGGEFQRNPLKVYEVGAVEAGTAVAHQWAPSAGLDAFDWRGEELDARRVADLWVGSFDHPAAEAAIVATMAVALRTLGRASSVVDAEALANQIWHGRLNGGKQTKAARRA